MASAQSLQSSGSDKLKEDMERKPDDNCMTCSLCKFHDNSRNHCDNPVCSWLAMDKEERDKHLKHMKNCILAPFLFGKKMNYSLKSITWLKSLKLIPITRSSPSRSCLSDRLIEVADVVEEIVDNLVSSLASEEFLHSSYHIYKELTECYLVEDAVLIGKKSKFVSLMGCCFNGSYCLDNKKIHLLSLTVLHQAMKYVCQTAKPGDCLTNFEEAVKRREPVCTELRLKGNAHFAAGEYQIAVACYSQAIKFSPFDPLLYGNRSQSYLKLKKLREALTDAKRTIYLRPEWEKGHYRFAQAYFELGFLEKAVAVNSFAQKCCSSTLNLLCQAVVFKREMEESAKKNRAHCCNPKGEKTVDSSHQHQQAYCNNPCFSSTKLGNKRNWKVANQTEAHDPVSKSSLKKDTDQHLPGSVDENDDCNPSDDNEDLELELSDTESIPPLIYDSSDDDDDCDDDLISLSGGSDLSDLPGLASCGESDTESLDSDSEFDGDDSDDHDDDLSFSDVGCECCNCGCCDEDLDNGDDEDDAEDDDDDISSESEANSDGDSDGGIDNVDILRSLMSPPILNGEVSPLLLLGVIHEFLSAHPEMMNEGSPPALPEVIESLPQAKVTKEHVGTNSSCSICQCDYEENETVLELPCAHLFHPPCITTWLKMHATCPTCRDVLPH